MQIRAATVRIPTFCTSKRALEDPPKIDTTRKRLFPLRFFHRPRANRGLLNAGTLRAVRVHHTLGGERVKDFMDETAHWLEQSIGALPEVELELGVLIAAASDWTEDEMELDDLVAGLVESGRIRLQIG